MRLSPEMRRLVALGEGTCGRKRGVLVEKLSVSSALEILKAHPEWGAAGLSFAGAPLRLYVRRVKRTVSVPEPMHYLVRRYRQQREAELVDVLEARWRSEDGAIDLAFDDALLFPGPSSFVRRRGGGPFFPVDPSVDIALAQRMESTPLLPIPTGAEAPFFRQLQARLRGRGVGLPSRASMGLPELGVPDLAVRIDGSPLDFEVLLEAVYSGDPIPIAGDGEDLRGGADSVARDDELERAAAERLIAAGLAWDRATRRFRPADEDRAVAVWETGVGMLRGEGSPRLEVYLSDRRAGVRVRGAVRSRVVSSRGGNCLESQVAVGAEVGWGC